MDIHKSINNTLLIIKIQIKTKLKVFLLKKKIRLKGIITKSLFPIIRKMLILKSIIQKEEIQHQDSFRLYLKRDQNQEETEEEIQDLVHYKK